MNPPPCKIALGEVNRANSACSSRGLMANYPTRRQRMQHKHGHSGETPGGTAPASGGRRRAPCLPEFGYLCCHEVRGYHRFMCFAFIFAEQRSCFVCQKWSLLGGWRGEEVVWVFARTLWPSVWLVFFWVFFFLSLCNQCQCSVSVIANLLRTLLGYFFFLLLLLFSLMLGWTPTLPFHSWTGIEKICCQNTQYLWFHSCFWLWVVNLSSAPWTWS